jgi:hydroxyacylglutathione hydrolase
VTVRVVPLPLSISNAYLLLGDRPVLVDAGKPGEEEKLLDSLHQHGIAPSDLALVVLTHGHTDHTGAVNAVCRRGTHRHRRSRRGFA